MTNELKIKESPIPGLFVVQLPVHGDSRGWFKENWQNEKFTALGFPEFKPVQNNISFNEKVGTTRGIHAEPWDKFISVANGKIFGAWVDLREGDSFGKTFTIQVDPSVAVFVPRGVGNAYQTLEPNTSYTYLVNDHWSPTAKYTFLNLADETASISWPIALSEVEISEKDLNHPRLAQVTPFKSKKTLIIGANGQLGKALQKEFPEALALGKAEFDTANPSTWSSIDWAQVDTLINASAYTKVDEAETPAGRKLAWSTNATGVGHLAKLCDKYGITMVHVSSDYVFDGTKEGEYTEEDEICPLGVYGQTKAAGELLAATARKHYIIRTSWVIGDGANFVLTMLKLARDGISPSVVDDQFGRLTFTSTISRAIKHLLTKRPAFGTYNLSCEGQKSSWLDIAKAVYELESVVDSQPWGTSTQEYIKSRKDTNALVSPRPKNSLLSNKKITSTGFDLEQWPKLLGEYLGGINAKN